MKTALVLALALARPALAEPSPPCDADSCDIVPIDPGPRPWILRDECRDDDVVGYRRCSTFGQWAAPARAPHFALELGLGWQHLVAPAIPSSSNVAARATTAPAGSASTLLTSALAIRIVSHIVYAGIELELGDLTGRAYPYGGLTQTSALAGLHVPWGPVALGGEALVGARSLERTSELDPPVWVTTPVIEVRARVELWLSPWITVAAHVGAGVLDRSEWSTGVALAFHTRTYGGER